MQDPLATPRPRDRLVRHGDQLHRSRMDAAAYELLPQRAGALLIDAAVWSAMALALGLAFGQTEEIAVAPAGTMLTNGVSTTLSPLQAYMVTCFWFAYLIVSESCFGAALGKMAVGLRVVRSNGARAKVTSIIVRHVPRFAVLTTLYLVEAVALLPLVFVGEAIIAAADERRQRLGDRLADTVVLRRRGVSGETVLEPPPVGILGEFVAPPPSGSAYAAVRRREGAFVVDLMIVMIIVEAIAAVGLAYPVITMLQASALTIDAGTDLLRITMPVLVGALYFSALNGRGHTLGKALLGIQVVDAAGDAPGLKRGAVRFIIPAIVGALMIGIPLVAAASDEDRPMRDPAILVGVGGISIAALLIALDDYRSVIRSARHQALHDRMAGTLVVLGQTAATRSTTRKTPGRLMVAAVIVIGLVVAGVLSFEVVRETPQDLVVRAMSDSLQAHASAAIADGRDAPTVVRFRESILDVNTASVPGQAGWEIDGSDTWVFGADLRVGEHGIALDFGDERIYSGVPVVVDSRIELENVRPYGSDHPFEEVLSVEGFERVIEDGLNGALAAHGLEPREIALGDDVLVVEVSPTDT